MIRMAFKYRLRPNGEQRRRMKRVAGSCRFVYNQALSLQRDRLDEDGRCWTYAELCRALTEWKRDADTAWLSEAPSHTLQQSLRDLCRAFTNQFEHGAGWPRFRRKGRRESFRYPDSKQFHLDQGNSRVFLPKLGWMRYRNSRAVEGRLRNITVSERCGEWYMSIQVEVDLAIGRHEGGVVGLDLGIVRFATLSDGTHYEPLNSFRRHEDRLRLAQRSLSRKVRGSRSWKRQKLRVAKVHARIADVRSDYLHKISHTVSKNHAVVCLEDLQVKRMSASARGTRDEPGRHVKAKSVLNRAILDQGWGEFRRQLEYKTHWQGGVLVVVPPHHTSTTCPECGHVSPDSRPSRPIFRCVACGFEEHADLVGAINVRRAGQARIAGEMKDAVESLSAGTRRNDLRLRDAA